MRILRLTTRLNISGPAMQAALLNRAMQTQGHETLLVAGANPSSTDRIDDWTTAQGVPVRIVPSFARSLNPFRQIQAIRDLVRLMREFAPDVVHTHTTTAGFAGRIAARIAGVPVVVHTLHTHPFRGLYSRFNSMMFVWLERIGSRLSDSIITLSTSLRHDLADRYRIAPKNHLTVLPLGYDLAPFVTAKDHDNDFRQQWHIPDDVPLIGIIGRLIPVKHHVLFLQVAQQIHAHLPQAHFVIVGDGILRPDLEHQAQQLGLGDCVTFTGWQSDMPRIYGALDAVVITSKNEGTPVPLIEALVAGVPVVATDVGGVRDVLGGGDYGRIVPSGDVNALTQALLATLQGETDATPAREAMLSRYSIERLADDLDALYRGLLASKQTRE
jgi:glycosyltransferase involved in cell wall biosynthesis